MPATRHRTGPADAWQRTARTALAVLVTVTSLTPLIIDALHVDPTRYPKLAAVLASIIALCAAITRVLAIPQVNDLLGRLRAPDNPPEVSDHDHDAEPPAPA